MMNEQPQRQIKVIKKGTPKTPSELKDSHRRLTISQVRIALELYPEEIKKIFSETLKSAL